MRKHVLLFGMIVATASTTYAQSKEVLLARTCLREAGFEITDDCSAIHAVIEDRVRVTKVPYEKIIRMYSKGKPSTRWIDRLTKAATQPAGWPTSGWYWRTVRRKQWLDLLKHAHQIVSGAVYAKCDPHHWGDHKGDKERALSYGWKMVPCGDTQNLFWITKRRDRRPYPQVPRLPSVRTVAL